MVSFTGPAPRSCSWPTGVPMPLCAGIPQTRVSQIIKGDRRVTADTALRLAKYFGNSAKFWLGLQDDFDLEEELKGKQKELAGIPAAQNLAA